MTLLDYHLRREAELKAQEPCPQCNQPCIQPTVQQVTWKHYQAIQFCVPCRISITHDVELDTDAMAYDINRRDWK